jgi:hypothetical protein
MRMRRVSNFMLLYDHRVHSIAWWKCHHAAVHCPIQSCLLEILELNELPRSRYSPSNVYPETPSLSNSRRRKSSDD